MTPTEFKNAWDKMGEKTSPLSPEQLAGFGLSPETARFLTESGLPEDAAPLLSFVGNSPNTRDRIGTLSTLVRQRPDLDHLVCVGFDGEGNPIAIDTSAQDGIVWLDHEDRFTPAFMNTSIHTLAECLLHYRGFIQLIRAENGEDAYLDSNFSEAQFNTLRDNMIRADKPAAAKGFWRDMLDALQPASGQNPEKPWWKFW